MSLLETNIIFNYILYTMIKLTTILILFSEWIMTQMTQAQIITRMRKITRKFNILKKLTLKTSYT